MVLGGKAIADGTSRVHAGATEVSPMNLLGTFAPYMTVHKDSVVKIDKDIPFETAAIMGCAVPTGYGSATNVAQVVMSGAKRRTADGLTFMPAFGHAYTDDEIAAVANYVTARFGSKGSKLTAQDVAELRKQTAE